MKKQKKLLALGISIAVLTACKAQPSSLNEPSAGIEITNETLEPSAGARQTILADTVRPEDFSLHWQQREGILLSLPGPKREVADWQAGDNEISWRYPNEQMAVLLVQYLDYLEVSVTDEGGQNGAAEIVWPVFAAEDYTLPLGEGKFFAADDPVWCDYLGSTELALQESFSMPFLAAGYGEQAVVYIFPDNYNNEVCFTGDQSLEVSVRHRFSAVSKEQNYRVRIYVTDNEPTAIADVYRRYVKETRGIKTLAQKAAENPNIEKLYGAPHIYLFDETVLAPEDVRWKVLKDQADHPVLQHAARLAEQQPGSEGSLLAVLSAIKTQDFVDNYQRRVITQELSKVIMLPEFYDTAVFAGQDGSLPVSAAEHLLTRTEQIERGKKALYASLPEAFSPPETWADSRSVDLLKSMKEAGIERAWIGLNSWEQAYIKPALVDTAVRFGWLVGPYDSYHSVHKPGQEEWITAAFPAEVYDTLTVVKQDGSHEQGFQRVGRKINPTLSMPYVKARVEQILGNGAAKETLPFNSWFVDCDATGELYDDYSPLHPTSMKEDAAARLLRMETIARDYGMVVGSEGGNDYAVNSIAFAHGIELPSFAWRDEDMKANRDSEYYLGRWYAADGGVPEKFARPVPLKEKYWQIFLNPAYQIPLYKLVYNQAVVTSYHWDWSSLKIKGQEANRRLYEMFYNVPPMYHLDQTIWQESGAEIAGHVRQWSDWSRQVILKEMTDFRILSDDRLVQAAVYEDQMIIVNWSTKTFTDGTYTVEPGGYLILPD